jgi:rhodanese-related sulfurtransferase
MQMKTVMQLALTLTLLVSVAPAFAGDDCSASKCDAAKTTTGKIYESALPKISRSDLQAKLDKVVLVNALDAKIFERSRIKGSVNVPFDAVEAASKVLPDKNADLVVYCMNTKCHASDKVADALAKAGYKNVSIYREGLQDWVAAGLPTEGTNPNEPVVKTTTAVK